MGAEMMSGVCRRLRLADSISLMHSWFSDSQIHRLLWHLPSSPITATVTHHDSFASTTTRVNYTVDFRFSRHSLTTSGRYAIHSGPVAADPFRYPSSSTIQPLTIHRYEAGAPADGTMVRSMICITKAVHCRQSTTITPTPSHRRLSYTLSSE